MRIFAWSTKPEEPFLTETCVIRDWQLCKSTVPQSPIPQFSWPSDPPENFAYDPPVLVVVRDRLTPAVLGNQYLCVTVLSQAANDERVARIEHCDESIL